MISIAGPSLTRSIGCLNSLRHIYFRPRYTQSPSKPATHVICIDVECTCDSPIQIYPMEIIEIACIRLKLSEGYERGKTFHSYVKPEVNPTLTPFCTELTGIMQSQVDEAPEQKNVIKSLRQWMHEDGLIDINSDQKRDEKLVEFLFASCGNFDLNVLNSSVSQMYNALNKEEPLFFRQWINVKKPFTQHFHLWPHTLYHMLELLELEPVGQHHSALDDCRNLATVIEQLHRKGVEMHTTSKIKVVEE